MRRFGAPFIPFTGGRSSFGRTRLVPSMSRQPRWSFSRYSAGQKSAAKEQTVRPRLAGLAAKPAACQPPRNDLTSVERTGWEKPSDRHATANAALETLDNLNHVARFMTLLLFWACEVKVVSLCNRGTLSLRIGLRTCDLSVFFLQHATRGSVELLEEARRGESGGCLHTADSTVGLPHLTAA